MPTVLLLSFAVARAEEDLAVDVVAGGLGRVATILTARHGVSVTYEGVPLLLPGLERLTQTDDRTTITIGALGQCGFRFTYPASATAREAAEAAVAAYHQTGCPGRYAVLEDQGIVHFVPYETRLDETTWKPYTPLLDTKLEVEVTEGRPYAVFYEIHAKLAAASGAKLLEPAFGVGGAGDVVKMPRASGTARQLLDDLLLQSGQATHYALVYVASEEPELEGWGLTFLPTKPSDEGVLNRTPLTPAPAPE